MPVSDAMPVGRDEWHAWRSATYIPLASRHESQDDLLQLTLEPIAKRIDRLMEPFLTSDVEKDKPGRVALRKLASPTMQNCYV